MKKYYIGLIILGLITLGLTGYVFTQGASSKQDNQTAQKAQVIADRLNQYVDTNGVPDSLAAANIEDVPDTISFIKKSTDTYEFCMTYKHAGVGYSSLGVQSILSGTVQQDASSGDTAVDPTTTAPQSFLYINPIHKAGKTCQTIQAYSVLNYNDTNPLQNSQNQGTSQSTTFDNSITPTNSADTERQADINSIQGQLEAYYAQNGMYPTLGDINDANWVSQNLKGFDVAALKDPSSTTYTLTSKPAKDVYSYNVRNANGGTCDNSSSNECTQYTLTATLSTGLAYSKNSLN